MGDDVGLGAWITCLAVQMEQQGTAPWRLKPIVVALNGNRVRLVERDPMLHTVSESLEAYLGVSSEIVAAIWALKLSYVMNDQLSSAKCVAEVIQVKGLTLSACPAIRCTCLPGPGAGPSGRGLHYIWLNSWKISHCQNFQAFHFDEILQVLFTFC